MIVTEVVFELLGRIILILRYPNKAKRKQALEDVYDNDYMNAGGEPIVKTIGITLFILLFLFLIAVIYSIFKHGPSAP